MHQLKTDYLLERDRHKALSSIPYFALVILQFSEITTCFYFHLTSSLEVYNQDLENFAW